MNDRLKAAVGNGLCVLSYSKLCWETNVPYPIISQVEECAL